MQVITTHINSDFDSMASMIAARKLYPEARLVFPGSLEANLRLLLKMPAYRVPFLKVRDVPLEEVDLLILVDTRLADRIGDFAKILGRPDLKIHIYDHHPSQAEDIKGDLEVVKPYGSATTIFVEIFRQRNITVSPHEATMMALGIYEDTGIFDLCLHDTGGSFGRGLSPFLRREPQRAFRSDQSQPQSESDFPPQSAPAIHREIHASMGLK